MPLAKPHYVAKQLGQPAPKKRPKIGLAQNATGVPFQCATCEYIRNGTCSNPDPELKGRKVQPDWCCDLYDHEGMKVIIG